MTEIEAQSGQLTLRSEVLTTAQKWERPTTNEVKLLINKLNLKGHEVGELLGIMSSAGSGNGSRTVRRWTSEKESVSSIPYAAWAILCYEAGYGPIWSIDR